MTTKSKPHPPMRVPGFSASKPAGQTAASSAQTGALSGPADQGVVARVELCRNAPVRQLGVRIVAPLFDRHERLLLELALDGYKVTVSESIHALLYAATQDKDSIREAVRVWRRATADAQAAAT